MVKEIKKDVFWLGVVDWDIRDFHGYKTSEGSTYNSYLIKDEKNVLIDTVKEHMCNDLLVNISKVINPLDIDYIVVNHVEKDHSGCVEKLVKISNATIVTNAKGKEHLERYYNTEDWEFLIVDSGDELNIGNRTLTFVKTPMLHWPDNMVTYSPFDKILFSNDAFGQHISSSERYDYEYINSHGEEKLINNTKEYFANILYPYKMLIPNTINTVKELDIELICPSHGIIWTEKNINKVFEIYLNWANDKIENKAVIVYDTMYNSTKKIAYALGEGLMEQDVIVKIYNLSETPMNTVMSEILDAKYVLIGSPTLNNNIYPEVSKFLAYMEGLKPANKIGVAFGSYGWMESATNKINEVFKNLNFNIVEDNCLKVKFKPHNDELHNIRDFATKLADLE